MYGDETWREVSGRVGSTLHTFSHGNSVNANQIASARPDASRKLAKVRPPDPGAPNNSAAGMSVRLRQRRFAFAPTRSTTSVTSARPRCVSSAAQSASSRV